MNKGIQVFVIISILFYCSMEAQVFNPPQKLFYHNNCNEVMLCWSAPEQGPDSILLYNIYKNGVYYASSEDSCELLVLAPGIYYFEVSALYLSGESDSIPISFFLPDYEPPTNLTYSINDTGAFVLHWDPVFMSSNQNNYWLYYDNGINSDGVGASNCFLWASIYFDSTMIVPYHETWATHLQFYSYQNAYESWYKVHAWTGEDGSQEIIDQDVGHHFIDKWNTIKFDNALSMNAFNDLYFGYKVWAVAGEGPLGIDASDGIVGFGDLLAMNPPSQGYWETLSGYGINYNWNIRVILTNDTANQSQFLGYRVYCDGEKINNFHFTDTSFIIPPQYLSNNTNFEVKANYIACESEAAVFVYNPTQIVDFQEKMVFVYPNPTDGLMHISSAKTIQELEVFSPSGKLLKSLSLNNSNTSIDLTGFKAGCYFLRFLFEDRTMVNRKLLIR